MGTTRSRLLFRIVSFFLSPLLIYANWNSHFNDQSISLIKQLPSIKDSEYESKLYEFNKIIHRLKKTKFYTQIQQCSTHDKKNFPNPKKFFLKKRQNNNINEAYIWELSLILGLSSFVTPSYPFEISNQKIIIQPWEELSHGSWLVPPAHNTTNLVSLENYWKAHLTAYILGFYDLSGCNIGITQDGLIRFFDNETIFFEDTILNRHPLYLSFISTAFDWPQYRSPIDETLSASLMEMMQNLLKNLCEIHQYCKVREIDHFFPAIAKRIEKITQFTFKPGMTFMNFYEFLYPEMSGKLDELSMIVGKILNRNIDHGIALFFTCRMTQFFHLTSEAKHEIELWTHSLKVRP